MSDWLEVQRGDAPLVVAFPHGGTALGGVEDRFVTPWLARRDADWWIGELYAFVRELGATTIATKVSRSIIDVNRDPSGVSLYPGQATTELCPTTTFDGQPLYRGFDPETDEIAWRRKTFFDPYHAALAAEIARLREMYSSVVLYDAHSIRSRIPRLFEGELPNFNIGTNSGASCAPELTEVVAAASLFHQLDGTWTGVVNGRFKGGWSTRHYGNPDGGVHAIQMELAMRGYLDEPLAPDESNWPPAINPQPPVQPILRQVIAACLDFAKGPA